MLRKRKSLKNFQHKLSDHVSIQGTVHSNSPLIILILPAMGASAKLYKRLSEGIIQAGMGAAVMNLRGDGKLPKKQLVSGGNFGYAELLADIENAVAYITKKHPGKKIITAGHSLGGQLGFLFQCHQNPEVIASIVIAGGNVGYQSWTGTDKLKTLFATQLFGLLARLLGWFPGKRIGFGGNQPKNIMIDWSTNARTGNYKPRNQKINYEKAAPNIKSLFLGLVIENDFFAPYPSTKRLVDKFPTSDTEIVTVKATNFKTITPDHFSWLKEPQPAIDIIVEWSSRKGLSSPALSYQDE